MIELLAALGITVLSLSVVVADAGCAVALFNVRGETARLACLALIESRSICFTNCAKLYCCNSYWYSELSALKVASFSRKATRAAVDLQVKSDQQGMVVTCHL